MHSSEERAKSRTPALSRIGRNMALGFSVVVLVLMLIVAISGSVFYTHILDSNERDLHETIAGLLADSINRVSFSGKYHARLLVEQIAESEPRIADIVIVGIDGNVIAQSDSKTGSQYAIKQDEATVEQVLAEEKTVFKEIDRKGVSIRQVAMPYRSGYQDRVTGVILVGISTEEAKKAETLTRILLTGLVLTLSLASLAATLLLSKRIAGPVTSLAWQFEEILDHAPLLIRISDRDGNVLRTSSSFASLPEDDSAILDAEIEEALETNQDLEREVAWRVRNRPATFLATSFPVLRDKRGTPSLACSIGLDITDLKQAEREREDLIAALEAQNAELERFAYSVSHDLKSPLITIKGYIGALSEDLAEGNMEIVHDDLARISNAADKMGVLLNDVLELSRVGRLVNPPQDVPLEELAGEVLQLVAGRLEQRSIQVEISPNLPVVYGDRVRLLEVLQNLLDNAVKYMGDQSQPQIEIGSRRDDSGSVCYVRDNGIGIEPRYHEKIFRLFDQLDQNVDGSGIGLALVKRIVEVHGGRVWVESEGLGQGSTFCFTIAAEGKSPEPVEYGTVD
jgi:signal transduction histidine kinase